MQNQDLKKLVMSALFAALTCAATFVIRIPTPGATGYVHPGDALVILSGVILGPVYGMAAAGIGSALADLLGGYVIYLPASLLLKGAVAFIAGYLYQRIGRSDRARWGALCLGGLSDVLLVTGGYFFYELFLYQTAAAVANLPANLLQGLTGLVLALILYPFLFAIPDVRQIAGKSRQG